jgi:hypothetical protein
MKTESYGTYPIRTIAHGESIIHMPNGITGKWAIYINDAKDVIVLRKDKGIDMDKLMKDVEKWERGEYVSLEEAKKEVGLE